MSYFDQTLENSKIITLTEDLNIISSTLINYPIVLKSFEHKINNKFYRVSFTNQDTMQFRCFDRNGNCLISKSLWIKNNEDTLWFNNWAGFKYRKLKNNNFLLVANAQYPSDTNEIFSSEALKLILFDTLGNILNTKIYPLKSVGTDTRICEVGEHLILEKLASTAIPTEYFGYRGISYINKETLEIEDSIPLGPFTDTLPNGIIRSSHHLYNLIAINDTTFAGLFEMFGKIKIHIFNKNTKEIIHIIEPTTSGNVSSEYNNNMYCDRFVFNTTDSIYIHYVDNGLTLLNFSSAGNINFQYKLTFPSIYEKGDVYGMKITDDGEVIISIYGYTFSPNYKIVQWLIKFNPKGIIGLTNIETGEKETINVYPNPAKDYINIDIEATNFNKGEIELFDMQGKLVKKDRLKGKQGNRIDVSNLNAGAHTYNVSLNGKTISGKVIIGK